MPVCSGHSGTRSPRIVGRKEGHFSYVSTHVHEYIQVLYQLGYVSTAIQMASGVTEVP